MRPLRLCAVQFPALLIVALSVATASAQKEPIQITADLTDAPRKIFHADIDIPVSPGPLDLISVEWVPGHHMPGGPAGLTSVVFTANGKTLDWRRDDVDMYEYHLTVPAGVTTLHARVESISARRVSQRLAALEWEALMLYPAHVPVKDIPIQPSVKVPAGWGIGTALKPVSGGAYPVPAAGAMTKFETTTVEQLEDSPVLTGLYFHEYPLAPTISPKHYLDVAADAPEDANLRPSVLAAAANLVREADALYASHHYDEYHFLLTLSDVAGGMGLEHGQSSDNGVGEKGYADDVHQLPEADLLSHEFTHSWNGKYRRPAGLYQSDFATPMHGALLWVYEGMTQYWGDVLAARSGLKSADQYKDTIAMVAADLDYTRGREWRSTEDTAVAASVLRGGNPAWSNWRRGQDYYFEGELLWLDADTRIRKMSDNKKSLNDFVKIFLGKGGNTGPLIVTYTFDELVQNLNQVVAYDWAKFLHDRVDRINQRADVAGLEQGGYKLVYRDKPTKSERMIQAAEGRRGGGIDCWYSIGLRLGADGSISDVLWNGPADKAGLAPGEKIIAVNDKVYSPDNLREAIRGAKDPSKAIRMIVQSDTFVSTVEINYHDGERYPALERVDGTPAYLDDIVKPLTTPERAPEQKKEDGD
ncbi:MAG: M61 family metallopeptidase [Acidobacteria bacterium]|nr:M61 family metallopeptidase [Acidobacteriota bacterium]